MALALELEGAGELNSAGRPWALCGQTLAGSGCCAQMPGPPVIWDACSEQQACISAFVASSKPPMVLSIYQQHPKQTKTFHTICPPVQRRILLKLVLPLIPYWCLVPPCVVLCHWAPHTGVRWSWVSQSQGRFPGIFTGCCSQGWS